LKKKDIAESLTPDFRANNLSVTAKLLLKRWGAFKTTTGGTPKL